MKSLDSLPPLGVHVVQHYGTDCCSVKGSHCVTAEEAHAEVLNVFVSANISEGKKFLFVSIINRKNNNYNKNVT